MGTPLSKVYNKFLGNINDKEWLLVEDEVIEDLMLDYLETATVDFTQCRKDLSFTPPERCEVKVSVEEPTSQITFTPEEKNTSINRIIGFTSKTVYEDFEEFSNGVIEFTSPLEEDVVIYYTADGEFAEDLETIEIRILAQAMLLSYLKPKIMTQESLKQFISDKDFTMLSGANMLLRLMGLKKNIEKELDVLQGKYAFKDFKGWN